MAEGEKACDALSSAGVLAVGSYGTGALPCDDSLRPLLGRNVLLWPDNDEAGLEHMGKIADRLQALGCLPYRVEWPDAHAKADAADYLANHSPEELQALLAVAVPWRAEREQTPEPVLIMPVAFAELEALVSATSWAWPGFLPNGALSILFAPPEAGKSYVGLDLMRCIATGADWPNGASNENAPARCLLIDFEGTQAEYLDRAKGYGIPLDMLLTAPPEVMPYLTDPHSFEAFRQWLEHTGARFLLIDSWRDGAPGVNEDKSGEVAPTLQPLKLIARDLNIPVLLDHHATKKGNSWVMSLGDLRGSGAFAAAARSIMGIDKPNAGTEARLLRVVKRNSGPKPSPIGFEFGPADEDGAPTGIVWTDPVYRHRATPKMDEAKATIREALRREALPHKELRAALVVMGVKQRTGDEALSMMEDHGQVVQTADGEYGLVSPLTRAG